MTLTAPVLWLNLSIVVCTGYIIPSKNVFSLKTFLLTPLVVVVLFLTVLFGIKFALNVQADSHIWTFFLAKLGFVLSEEGVPFETSIYLCHAGFTFMGWDFIERTQKNGVLQLYILVVVVFVLMSLYSYCESVSSEQCVVVVKSLLFGFMAYTTMRMKFVFLPQMAIVAASFFGLFDRFTGKFFKYAIICAIVSKLSFDHYHFYLKVLSREQACFNNTISTSAYPI